MAASESPLRTWHPRTGTDFYRTRHLKCDEEKPTCRRCRVDRFTCDGYKEPKPVSVARECKGKKKPSSTPQLVVAVSSDVHGSALERYFFHHIRQCTIEYLTFSSEVGFWLDVVLPTAHSDDSVRHALVALGMAHRLFMERPGVHSLDGLVLRQYNEAIRQLTDGSAARSGNIRQTLICCLVFFCLESVIGHYAQALDHLRAGSKLLAPYLQGNSSKEIDGTNDEKEILRKIADVIGVIGVDAGFFLDENLVSALGYYSLPEIKEDDHKKPFKSIAEARREVNRVVVNFNHAVDFCGRNWYAPELCGLYERFRIWAVRFDNTTFHFGKNGPSTAEKHELLALQLSRKLWLSAIDCEIQSRSTSGEFQNTFGSVLDDAEALIKPFASVAHPVFTLQADIIPAIAYVCDLTTYPDVQRRAINLLRSIKRREGIWDSEEIAEYLEDYLLAKEMMQMNWDSVPGGVPGSVRILSGMNMSHMSQQNGIWYLALETQENGADADPSRRMVTQRVLRDNVKNVFGENPAGGGILDRREVPASPELKPDEPEAVGHRAVIDGFRNGTGHTSGEDSCCLLQQMQAGYCVRHMLPALDEAHKREGNLASMNATVGVS